MNSGSTPPPARERNRYGLRSVQADLPPQTAEALFDKVAITVRGSIRGQSENQIRDFVALIGAGPRFDDAPRLFGRGDWNGNYWQARPITGENTVTGSIDVRQRGAGARIDLQLSLNPIRTLEQTLRRYALAEVLGASPIEFFRYTPMNSAALHTLDRQDNMVSDYLRFAGSTQAGMVQRVATYLDHFETMLKARLLHELAPSARGYNWSEADGSLIARSDDVELRLEWGQLAVTHCEVCWERRQDDALQTMHHMADRSLAAARDVTVQHHFGEGGASVSRDLGALTVTIPLVPNRSIRLVSYAKAADRLRFEVRYSGSVSRHIRDRLPVIRSLNSWLRAFREDAAERIRWPAVVTLLTPPAAYDVDALLDLLEGITVATKHHPAVRRAVSRDLLTHGALTCTGVGGSVPVALVKKLINSGVIEHLRLVARDCMTGRRFRLVEKYAGLPGLVSSR